MVQLAIWIVAAVVVAVTALAVLVIAFYLAALAFWLVVGGVALAVEYCQRIFKPSST